MTEKVTQPNRISVIDSLRGSLAAFAVLLPLWMYLPGTVENRTISTNLGVILNMWKNFAMMSFYVSGITLLFYRTRAMKACSSPSLSSSVFTGSAVSGPKVTAADHWRRSGRAPLLLEVIK